MRGLYAELGVEDLRRRMLAHTRRVYARLPLAPKPRLLDIGCGRGLLTVELARLSGGEVVAIDIDRDALAALEVRLSREGLADRVTVLSRPCHDTGLEDERFDLLWEEGVFHLLDYARTFRECHRLLRPGGYLVMHETTGWLASARPRLRDAGFAAILEHPLPERAWWTDYGAPLEARLQAFRRTAAARGEAVPDALAIYEAQVDALRTEPSQWDCAFLVVRRVD